jgi:long-subunit fatty acid transport protein
MTRLATAAAILAATTTAATAGGLDRSGQSVGVIFQPGDYMELSFGSVNPTVSGTYVGGSQTSGDIAPSYNQLAAGYRNQLTENFAFALIFDQPWGADVNYPATGTFAALTNTTAELSSSAITALGQFRINDNVSIYGGIKSTTVSMNVSIPGGGALNYTGVGSATQAYGYVIGAAYEIPDIALRAALTYHSASTFDIATRETSVAAPGGVNSTTRVTLPQAVNLDFQTGIMADTLLMAGIRWANWTQTNISPNHYSVTLGRGALQSYSEDVFTYSLGVGRRFNENWAGSVMLGYERPQGGITGNLAPTDGYTSLTVGASYKNDGMDISGGVRYVRIGDATSTGAGGANGTFSGNSAIGVGMKVGFSF